MVSRFVFPCIIVLSISFSINAQTIRDSLILANDTAAQQYLPKVEREASYPGGEIAWKKFLQQNLNAGVAVANGAPAGLYSVSVQFIVDKDGNVTDIKPLTNWGYGMEAEVVRIIKKAEGWSPASIDGKPVKAYRKQPVTFMVEAPGLEVHPEKGNCLYVGVDNRVIITAANAKDKNLRVNISQGEIFGGDGQYIAQVTTVGRALIEVYNKNKKVGQVSLEVRAKPSSNVRR
jgi:gliding motility-associated GldM-like protein/TonB-like protein